MDKINLLIAMYKNEMIHYSEYNRSIHHGKIVCPWCEPRLRVTDSGKGYFMAWKNEGRHNCGIGQIRYVDANWKGRKIVEIITENSQGEVIIDMNLLFRDELDKSHNRTNPYDADFDVSSEKAYYTYEEKKEIFRDIVRSVVQMKNFIEQNPYEKIKNLKFSFRMDENEKLNINEVVLASSELNYQRHCNKKRFVICKVESIKKVYINAYSANDVALTIQLHDCKEEPKFKVKRGEYIIAFGKIIYSPKQQKYFLNITNDIQVKKIKEKAVEKWFEDVTFAKHNFRKREIEIKEEQTEAKEIANEEEKKKINDIIGEEIYPKIECPEKEQLDEIIVKQDITSGYAKNILENHHSTQYIDKNNNKEKDSFFTRIFNIFKRK